LFSWYYLVELLVFNIEVIRSMIYNGPAIGQSVNKQPVGCFSEVPACRDGMLPDATPGTCPGTLARIPIAIEIVMLQEFNCKQMRVSGLNSQNGIVIGAGVKAKTMTIVLDEALAKAGQITSSIDRVITSLLS
jgi:hypothetical protein